MKHKIRIIVCLLAPLLNYSQEKQAAYYTEFDNIVGTISNELNQGLRFVDAYNRTVTDNDFRYFQSKAYTSGNMLYKNQPFFDCNIKYDLLTDNLLFKSETLKSNFDIILDANHLDQFVIFDQVFVKLPNQASKFSFYKNGFFEQIYKGTRFKVFLKHEKFEREKLDNKVVFYKFRKAETYVLEYESKFYEIGSKKAIIEILPDQKTLIKNFYSTNRILESENPKRFMNTLFKHLE